MEFDKVFLDRLAAERTDEGYKLGLFEFAALAKACLHLHQQVEDLKLQVQTLQHEKAKTGAYPF